MYDIERLTKPIPKYIVTILDETKGKGNSQTLVVWIRDTLFGILVSLWNTLCISIVGTIDAHVPSELLEVKRGVKVYGHAIYES